MKTAFNEQVKKRAKGIERENPANIPEKGNNYKGPENVLSIFQEHGDKYHQSLVRKGEKSRKHISYVCVCVYVLGKGT